MKKTITVRTNSAVYGIFIGPGITGSLNSFFRASGRPDSAFIISSPRVFGLYGREITGELKTSGVNDIATGIFGDGERNKSMPNYECLLGKIIDFESGKQKQTTIIALGGGVVGDMAGFVASTYRRGVPCIQIPTTLLAAVDSSVGGKTGIDIKRNGSIIKNIAGTFYQPSAVFINTGFLGTLPESQVLNGLSEVIKYGVIRDHGLFDFIGKNRDRILNRESGVLAHIIHRSCSIKKDVVEKDEKETRNVRTILNYGHTVGHAVESASGFRYSHGQSVAIGMVCEAEISAKLGVLSREKCLRIRELIESTGLPVKIKGCSIEKIMGIMKHDKKFREGKNKFALPSDIGKVVVKTDIQERVIKSVLAGAVS